MRREEERAQEAKLLLEKGETAGEGWETKEEDETTTSTNGSPLQSDAVKTPTPPEVKIVEPTSVKNKRKGKSVKQAWREG